MLALVVSSPLCPAVSFRHSHHLNFFSYVLQPWRLCVHHFHYPPSSPPPFAVCWLTNVTLLPPRPQIFNLMKFDSYSRFLKSSLYQECMRAEVDGRPLPDPYQIPCSPAPSKHSASSDRSTLSTPKKVPLLLFDRTKGAFHWSKTSLTFLIGLA